MGGLRRDVPFCAAGGGAIAHHPSTTRPRRDRDLRPFGARAVDTIARGPFRQRPSTGAVEEMKEMACDLCTALCGLHGAGWPHSAADRTPLSPHDPGPQGSRRSPPPTGLGALGLDALPLQMSFSGPAEVSRYLSRRVGHPKPTQSTGTAGHVCSRRQVGRRSTSWCVGARAPAEPDRASYEGPPPVTTSGRRYR